MSLKGAYKHIAKRKYDLTVEQKKVRKRALTAASHGEPCLQEEQLKLRGYTPEQIRLYTESYEESAGSPETQRQRTLKRKAQQAQQAQKARARKSRLREQKVSEEVTQISPEEPILTLEIETWEEIQLQTPREHALSELTASVQHIDDILSKSFSAVARHETEKDHFWDILFNDGMYFNFNANSGMTEYVEPENTLTSPQISGSLSMKVDL